MRNTHETEESCYKRLIAHLKYNMMANPWHSSYTRSQPDVTGKAMEYYYLPRSHTTGEQYSPCRCLNGQGNCTRLTIADLSLRASIHLFLLIPGEHSNNCSLNHLPAAITAFACQFSSITRPSGCLLRVIENSCLDSLL